MLVSLRLANFGGILLMKMPSSMLFSRSLPAIAGLTALTVTTAHSQTPVQEETSGETLEEVTVTAQRRTESLQTTPLSVSVLSAEALEAKGVSDLNALQYAAPAVTISQYGSANVFNIRGIGRSQVDIDVPSGVVIYRDGAPTVAGYFQNEPYFDLEGIQVFRGPQGTFVGKSAAGGAVFINSRDPELGEFSGSVQAGLANYSGKEFTGVLNAPAGDTFALRFAYKHYDRDNFYDGITGDYTGHPGDVDNNSFRASALWAPNDSFRGVLKIDYSDLDFGGNVTSVYGEDPLGTLEQNADFAYRDKSLRTVLDMKYKTANGITFSSLTGYQDVDTVNNLDVNATLPAYYYFQSKGNIKVASQEFNLISPDEGKFTWVTGAFYQRQKSTVPNWEKGGFNFIGNGSPPDFPWGTTPWDKTEDEWAVFAHVGFKFTDALQLEVGTRYSHYAMDQTTEWILNFSGTAPDPDNPDSIHWSGSTGPDTQRLSEGTVDGQVALNWTVNDQHFLYGLISRGHITGGVNLFPAFESYREMQVINYEVGWKASFADDHLRTQTTVYYETFDNYQANFAVELLAGFTNPTNRNAETRSNVSGFEFTAQAQFGGFQLDAGVAYLDSELGRFSNVVDPFRTAPDNVVNLSGARTPFSPEWTGNVGLAYAIPIGDLKLTPRVDVSYISETQGALWDTPLETLEARTLTNAQITLAPASDKWSATLWSTNVTDKHYVAGIQNNATLFYAGAPRFVGARVSFNF